MTKFKASKACLFVCEKDIVTRAENSREGAQRWRVPLIVVFPYIETNRASTV